MKMKKVENYWTKFCRKVSLLYERIITICSTYQTRYKTVLLNCDSLCPRLDKITTNMQFACLLRIDCLKGDNQTLHNCSCIMNILFEYSVYKNHHLMFIMSKKPFKTLLIAVSLLSTSLPLSHCTPHFKIDVLYKPPECERESKYGDQMFVHFVGKKADTGETFDKSIEEKPYRFQLGTGEVIEGFDEGLVNMCPGEKRKLTVPPHMAYGHGGGHLPQMPGGTLVFEVELVHAEEGPRHPKVFKEMDIDGDKFLSKFELREYLRKEVTDANAKPMSLDDEVKLIEDILAMEDVDKDGYISHTEFSGTKHDEF
ncbi:peptidyl-prolyl cis-trans isomerase FKBP14-like [Clavelina lepadiformis]|uniref:peptidyl-prolyl cis-trans isomerase FKBP14-like n=1 Tax=Clavelina lepadiformis TaxID=159417 RepID=UPI0040423624